MTSHKPNTQQIFEGGPRTLFYGLVTAGGLSLLLMALPFFSQDAAGNALAAEGPQEVQVVLTEFTIQPASFSFEAGDQVVFVVENQGQVAHEFRLTSGSSATAHAEGGHEGHDDSAGGTDEHGDVWLLVDPKQTETLEITFDEHSTFDLAACLLPGHYEEGMTSRLSIAGLMVMADDGHAHGAEDDHATEDHADAAEDDHATEDHADAAGDDHATEDHADAAGDDHATEDHADAAEDHATEDHADAAEDHLATEDHADAAEDHHATEDHAMDAAVVDREVLIFMDEYEFDPPDLELRRGDTVRFTIINAGDLTHEFRFTTEHAAEEHLAGSSDGHHAADNGDLMALIDPGAAATLTVTFDGDTALDLVACFLDNHLESGMSAPLTITS